MKSYFRHGKKVYEIDIQTDTVSVNEHQTGEKLYMGRQEFRKFIKWVGESAGSTEKVDMSEVQSVDPFEFD